MVFLEALLFHTVIQGLLRFLAQFALGASMLRAGMPARAEAATPEAGCQEASAPAGAPKPFRFVPAPERPAS